MLPEEDVRGCRDQLRSSHLLLRPVRILLRVHLFHADFQPAVFRERHVLLLHVLLAAVCQLVAPQVDLVAEVGGAADDGEEDDEWEEGGEGHVGRDRERARVGCVGGCWRETSWGRKVVCCCCWDYPGLGWGERGFGYECYGYR